MQDQNSVVSQGAAAQDAQPGATTVQNPQTVSQNPADAKLAKLRELNNLDQAGKPIEGKGEPTGDADGSKQKQAQPAAKSEENQGDKGDKASRFSKKIGGLIAQNKDYSAKIQAQKSRIAELEKSLEEMKKAPKYTKEHFATDEEYEDWKDSQRTTKIRTELALDQAREQMTESTNNAFKQSWNQKVSSFYKDPEDIAAFRQTLANAKAQGINPPQAVHDYVQHSDIGPVMLEYLLATPEAMHGVSNVPAVVQAARLSQIEQGLYRLLHQQGYFGNEGSQAQPQPAQTKVTQAPAPIGPVGQRSEVSVDGSSSSAAKAYKRKHYGGH